MHPKNANIKLIFNCFQRKTKKKNVLQPHILTKYNEIDVLANF